MDFFDQLFQFVSFLTGNAFLRDLRRWFL
jgi:hypothetical protein